jgi:hypothetical protein
MGRVWEIVQHIWSDHGQSHNIAQKSGPVDLPEYGGWASCCCSNARVAPSLLPMPDGAAVSLSISARPWPAPRRQNPCDRGGHRTAVLGRRSAVGRTIVRVGGRNGAARPVKRRRPARRRSQRCLPSAKSHASTPPGSAGLRCHVCRAPVGVSIAAAFSASITTRAPFKSQRSPH